MNTECKFIGYAEYTLAQAKTIVFKNGNRLINRGHIAKVKQGWLKRGAILPPIMVNTLSNVLTDGQHRLIAFIELMEAGLLPEGTTIKVMLVEIPLEEEMDVIIDLNCNSKNWSLDDYIHSYAQRGFDSYVKLEDWCKLHSLTCDKGKPKTRYGAATITGKGCALSLKNGTFECNDDDCVKGDSVHAEMLEIVDVFGLEGKGPWIESLAISWSAVRGQHDFKTWMKEFRAKRRSFKKLPMNNTKDWDNIFAQAHLAIDKKSED